MSGSQKTINAVPRWVVWLLAAGLLLQGLFHVLRPPPLAVARDLPIPPALSALEAVSLGEPEALAKLLTLWLQAFDNQPGISIPFRELDYGRVQLWLERILGLDPRGQYPLLAASRLYAEIPDEPRQRQMMEFVHRQFLLDPDRRWRWMAHVAILARHRLQDMDLALRYSSEITRHARGPAVPGWARDMAVLLLQDMGELEAARVMVGGLLDSGEIRDSHELRFLEERLQELQAR